MFLIEDKYVAGMASIRFLSAALEFSAAILMLKLNKVEEAMKVNAVLAIVGPVVLTAVTGLGIAGLAGKVPFHKMIFIIMGVGLILYGVRQN